MSLKREFLACRVAGTPLVLVRTTDPAAAVLECVSALNGASAQTAIVRWDCHRGPVGLNPD